jgi:hypothetical protein
MQCKNMPRVVGTYFKQQWETCTRSTPVPRWFMLSKSIPGCVTTNDKNLVALRLQVLGGR